MSFSVHSSAPPLSVVRKFAHLLEFGDNDIRQEGELLRLREEVVRSIRANRQLEADLDVMDLKIGLLVRNRVTLQVRGGDELCLSVSLQLSVVLSVCLSVCVCVGGGVSL